MGEGKERGPGEGRTAAREARAQLLGILLSRNLFCGCVLLEDPRLASGRMRRLQSSSPFSPNCTAEGSRLKLFGVAWE